MKIFRPFEVTAIADSNVLETPPSAYNAGTSYSVGQQVSVFSGASSTTATMYESLQNANTGNTPSSSPLWWQEIGTAYLAYNGATAYAVDAIVTDTTTHKLYKSLQGSNTGHAVTEADWWLELGPSNKWAMFDGKTGTQTTRPLEVMVEIDVDGRADTVTLLNVDAASVNVTVMDGVTEAYNEDFSLTSTNGITDWFSYFFEPIVRRTDLKVDDLPNVTDPTIIVTATDSDDVSIGLLAIGLSREIGGTQYGARVGITDYSRLTEDDFGNWYFVQRGYAKRGRFDVTVEAANVDYVFDLLASYRATPIVILGSDSYGCTLMYGIFSAWEIGIEYVSHSILTADFKGV